MSVPEPPAGFWHCPRCRTPNPSASYVLTCVACGAGRPRGEPARPRANTAGTSAAGATHRRSKPAPWLIGLTACYGTVVLLVLALVKFAADIWWPATVLAFAPRAPWLIPLAALATLNLRVRRWPIALAHAITALVILGPLMGLKLPIGRILHGAPAGTTIHVLTFNRGGDHFRAAELIRLIEERRIDVICFQEPELPPAPAFRDPALASFFAEGWYHNESWTIVSRLPFAEEMETRIGEFRDDEFRPGRLDRAVVMLPSGQQIGVACVHFPTVRFGMRILRSGQFERADEFFAWRRRQVVDLLTSAIAGSEVPSLVAGDFNAAYDSPMFDPIRPMFREGFDSVGLGYAYTRPASWPWIGIDYVLATPEWTFTGCDVGPDIGSDHRPVIAEVVLPGQATN